MNLISSITDRFLLEFPGFVFFFFPFHDVLDSYLSCHLGFFLLSRYYTRTEIRISEPACKYYAVRFRNTCGFKEA